MKRKTLDFSVMKEEISQNNVLILFPGNYAYQFGNNVVPEKYAVARERDFIAIDIKIARTRKSIKFFAEKRKQIDSEFLRILVQPYAALLH